MNVITEVPILDKPKEKPIIELFIGDYTGMLKTLVMKDHRRITFTPAFPLVKGVAYVLEYAPSSGKCRLIHVVIPRI